MKMDESDVKNGQRIIVSRKTWQNMAILRSLRSLWLTVLARLHRCVAMQCIALPCSGSDLVQIGALLPATLELCPGSIQDLDSSQEHSGNTKHKNTKKSVVNYSTSVDFIHHPTHIISHSVIPSLWNACCISIHFAPTSPANLQDICLHILNLRNAQP